ncbi:hypothetical protein [uncultured Ruthenibacterium sp.]|uniref:hypothetical protein n=1 Tax=uncultured Ruthenibacterium sp. TaxID=1905347 RepID=UPI00349EC47B
MRKWILTLCALATVFSLAACSSAPSSASTPASEPASSASTESVSEPASESTPDENTQADYTAYSIEFDVPEGFEQMDATGTGTAALYQASDGSSVNVVIMENNGSLASDVAMEDLVGPLEQAFSEQFGEEVYLLDVKFETGTLGVCPYYRLDYSVTVAGVELYQTALGINADRAYTITYTDTTYGGWSEAFEQSIDSIKFVESTQT